MRAALEKVYDPARYWGRKWGKAHGYYGEVGGWIYYKEREKPACQGWANLYYLNRHTIEAWIQKQPAPRG